MPALDRLGLTNNARVLVIFRISCAALATSWKEVEVWFAWLSRSRNCSGSISHGPRCRPRHRRTCRTTYPLSARLYKVDMARKKQKIVNDGGNGLAATFSNLPHVYQGRMDPAAAATAASCCVSIYSRHAIS